MCTQSAYFRTTSVSSLINNCCFYIKNLDIFHYMLFRLIGANQQKLWPKLTKTQKYATKWRFLNQKIIFIMLHR